MNSYCLIRGFNSYEDARDYADRLPTEAVAKVVPYRDRHGEYFAVDVVRTYTGGRL